VVRLRLAQSAIRAAAGPAQGADPAAEPRPAKKPAGNALPASGAELERRLKDYDARLAAEGLCRPDYLVRHVTYAGIKAGHGAYLSAWGGPAIRLAVEATKDFEAGRRNGRPAWAAARAAAG
jgi:hypothetical protein